MAKFNSGNGCEHCGSWPVVLVQKCHPDAATLTLLDEDGQVTVICADCDQHILTFQSDLRENENVFNQNLH